MEDLEIVGHKTEKNELEDFWMARVVNLEKQYDEHMVKLEKKLFDSRFHSRILASVTAEKEELAQELRFKTKSCKTLTAKIEDLGGQVQQLDKQRTKLKGKLDKAQTENVHLIKTVRGQESALRKASKETRQLGNKLVKIEQEKKKLAHDVSVRDNELKQWRHSELKKESQRLPSIVGSPTFPLNVVDMQNKQLVQMNRLIQQGRTREEKLHDMRKHLEQKIKEMEEGDLKMAKSHWEEKRSIQKQLLNVQEDLTQSLAKLDLQKQRTEQWREEVHFRDARLKSEVTHNQISNLRGQVATLKGQLKSLELDHQRFHEERSKLAIKLGGLESLEKSLQQLIKDNIRTRNEIVKRMSVKQDIGSEIGPRRRSSSSSRDLQQGYEKQINRLEKRMNDLEAQLISTRRRENSLRWELQKQSSTLISQIHWTNKARFKVEAQNRDSQKLCNAWARQIAQNSDPGYHSEDSTNRRTRERVLQRRLASQTSKLEKLRTQLRVNPIVKEPSQTDPENWKWINFIKSHQESLHSNESIELQKKYIKHLDESIATLGKELTQVERKQAILTPLVKDPAPDLDDDNGFEEVKQEDKEIQSTESSTPSEELEESSVISSSSSNKSSDHSHSDSAKDS